MVYERGYKTSMHVVIRFGRHLKIDQGNPAPWQICHVCIGPDWVVSSALKQGPRVGTSLSLSGYLDLKGCQCQRGNDRKPKEHTIPSMKIV